MRSRIITQCLNVYQRATQAEQIKLKTNKQTGSGGLPAAFNAAFVCGAGVVRRHCRKYVLRAAGVLGLRGYEKRLCASVVLLICW